MQDFNLPVASPWKNWLFSEDVQENYPNWRKIGWINENNQWKIGRRKRQRYTLWDFVYILYYLFSAIVIAGGTFDIAPGAAEAFYPNGTKLCTLPEVYPGKEVNTLNGIHACGGSGGSRERNKRINCVTLIGGNCAGLEQVAQIKSMTY